MPLNTIIILNIQVGLLCRILIIAGGICTAGLNSVLNTKVAIQSRWFNN